MKKGYSDKFFDVLNAGSACARAEGVNASYKDLSQVCRTIRNRTTDWAMSFLEAASQGLVPVPYSRHNKKLGHRKSLGGLKGRYPLKAAKMVLKVLQSAIDNGARGGKGERFLVAHASANRKNVYSRVASKGRWARSDLETSRIEIVLTPMTDKTMAEEAINLPEKTVEKT